MIRLTIVGVGGRMGEQVSDEAADRSDVERVAGLETSDSELVGERLGDSGRIHADAESAMEEADVAVDFSVPDALADAARAARAHGVALVSGTTGLDEEHERAVRDAADEVPVLRAANFSVGVNILKRLVADASRATDGAFDVEIFEAHHRNKTDAPSGTALTLGDAAAEARGLDLDDAAEWSRCGDVGPRSDDEIGFQVLRGGGITGDHTVALCGESERIELTHRAGDRGIFAKGALRAAAWLEGRSPGLYSMEDVLFG